MCYKFELITKKKHPTCFKIYTVEKFSRQNEFVGKTLVLNLWLLSPNID